MRRSAFQDIELARDPDGSLSLTLDSYWQFSSHDEATFHEVLVDVPMVMAARARRVLILGGGDGLAARNALRYPDVEQVVLCELDPAVIEMTRTVTEMRVLTNAALDDPRVQVVTKDAHEFVRQQHEPFDVVVCDFPAQTDPEGPSHYRPEFLERLDALMSDGAVLSVQVSLDPPDFWSTVDAVAGQFGFVQSRLAELHDDSWADFILASRERPTTQRPLAPGLVYLDETRMQNIVIRNHAGDHFETAEYGRRPDFAEPR